MKKNILISVLLSINIIIFSFVISKASAQNENLANSNIQYPVKQLGNCASEQACKNYCDKFSNIKICLDFAKEHNLMSAQEIETARKFLEAGAGPGGCKTKDSCETYCNSIDHIDECVAFAEKNNLLPPDQLEEAKKVKAAKDRGVKIPACGGKKQCDVYCSEPAHMEECITFAQEAGFMSSQELEDSKKMLAAIKAGATPPPCRGKQECDSYCSQEEHFDACLDFALAAGFMNPKDAEMAKKTKGKGPGGCRGKEQCDAFCQQDANMLTCAQFAYDNGMMTKDEFENFKKTGGKGPGGCKSKDECENFCNNPDNQETCFNFAKENGLIIQEDLQRMEQGKQQFKEAMQNIPPEVYSCLESAVGTDIMAKFKNGEAMPPKEIGDKMRECFEKNIPQRPLGAPGEGGNMPPAGGGQPNMAPGATGPGGCATPEECQKFCQTNPEQCKNFQQPGQFQQPQPGQMPPNGGMMPGAPIPSSGAGAPPTSQPPPPGGSTAPGAGGETAPGIYVPPTESFPSAPPAKPAPSPTSYKSPSILGLIFYPLVLLFK